MQKGSVLTACVLLAIAATWFDKPLTAHVLTQAAPTTLSKPASPTTEDLRKEIQSLKVALDELKKTVGSNAQGLIDRDNSLKPMIDSNKASIALHDEKFKTQEQLFKRYEMVIGEFGGKLLSQQNALTNHDARIRQIEAILPRRPR